MEGKTTMTYHYTSVRLAKILKSSDEAEENTKKLDHSYVVDGNVKWYNHSEKQFGGFI